MSQASEELSRDPRRSALVMDFDGVLSPIVEVASQSAFHPRARAAVTRLAQQFGLVAVLSGRPLSFLLKAVTVPGIKLMGSYGFEKMIDGQPSIIPEAMPFLPAVAAATTLLHEAFDHRDAPGIVVEEKTVSVAVHWRLIPQHKREAAASEVREEVVRVHHETGLHIEPGKLVEELRPPLDVNKGTALVKLLSEGTYDAFAYAGDDKGDVPALIVARELGGFALAVDHGNETDGQVLDLADEVFLGVHGFSDWLEHLADRTAVVQPS